MKRRSEEAQLRKRQCNEYICVLTPVAAMLKAQVFELKLLETACRSVCLILDCEGSQPPLRTDFVEQSDL